MSKASHNTIPMLLNRSTVGKVLVWEGKVLEEELKNGLFTNSLLGATM